MSVWWRRRFLFSKTNITLKTRINLQQTMQKYSNEPLDSQSFTKNFDKFYTRFAPTYNLLVKYLPVWRNWLDYNWLMLKTASENLSQKGYKAELQQADVSFLPYATDSFDTIVNTMAFSGYPDGRQALKEIKRVLKPNGKLVIIDIDYPKDNNWLGIKLTNLWMAGGDIIRDMDKLFKSLGWKYEDKEIGAFGSVHLYIATSVQYE